MRHATVSPHPEPLVRELFRLWWPGISLETVRAAQREANRLPEGFWLAVLYISGGALIIALILGLIFQSVLLPALLLAVAIMVGLGHYFERAWKLAYTYPLPLTSQIPSVASNITTENHL